MLGVMSPRHSCICLDIRRTCTGLLGFGGRCGSNLTRIALRGVLLMTYVETRRFLNVQRFQGRLVALLLVLFSSRGVLDAKSLCI